MRHRSRYRLVDLGCVHVLGESLRARIFHGSPGLLEAEARHVLRQRHQHCRPDPTATDVRMHARRDEPPALNVGASREARPDDLTV